MADDNAQTRQNKHFQQGPTVRQSLYVETNTDIFTNPL